MSEEITFETTNGPRSGLLSMPLSGVRGGLVPLHPADDPSREQFLFRHLAEILPTYGIAVLRYDRRPNVDDDVSLELQAQDALSALQALSSRIENVPLGLWGFSQGAWAAPLAAARSPDIAFLTLIASTGVSPAMQMRYGTVEQLRRAGYDQKAQAALVEVRVSYEQYLRGDASRTQVQATIDQVADQPWFTLAYVRRELPPPGAWRDMDFDPVSIFAQVTCPVLLFYGEDDEWTPVEASIAGWQHAATVAGNTNISVVRLPGTSHYPTLHDERGIDAISPLYVERLIGWLTQHLPAKRYPTPDNPM